MCVFLCDAAWAPFVRRVGCGFFTLVRSGAVNEMGPFMALTENATVTFKVNNVPFGADALINADLFEWTPTARLVSATAITGRTLKLVFTLRLRIDDVTHVLDNVAFVVTVDNMCFATALEELFTLPADAPAFVRSLFKTKPASPVKCAVGEQARADVPSLRGHGNLTDCVPTSCESARACGADAVCRPRTVGQTRAAGGVGFDCGCAKGYAANLHLGVCVAVSCDAPTACSPLGVCEPFAVDELDECNPTPTMGWQWRRGPAPCPRFRCRAQ